MRDAIGPNQDSEADVKQPKPTRKTSTPKVEAVPEITETEPQVKQPNTINNYGICPRCGWLILREPHVC